MVEGAAARPSSSRRFRNHHQHALQRPLIQNVGRRDAHHTNAALRQPPIPPEVVVHLLRQVVMRAIDLNRQPSLRMEEVEHIGSDRMLPSEAQPIQTSVAKAVPEDHLREAQIPAEPFRALECPSFRPHRPSGAPSTMLRMVPLPVNGGGSRKRKLLDKQKEGKKRMRQFDKVDIPQEAFIQALKMGD